MKKKLAAGVLVVLGLVIVLFFGFRIVRVIGHWHGPPHPQLRATTTDTTLIREWMTIPYIARTYGLPDRMLFKALDIPEQENRKKSLLDINNQYFPEQEGFVIARIQQAILEFQEQAPSPPLPASPPNDPAVPTP